MTKLRARATILAALVAMLTIASSSQPLQRPIVITNVTVIDATAAPARPKMTVVVTGGRIADIGRAGKVRVPKNATLVNGTGKFLIPGLWDMHTHLDTLDEAGLGLFVANGVTSIREMGGGDFDKVKLWRARAESGTIIGPRVKASGPILESTRFIQVIERLEGRSYAGKRIGIGTVADVPGAVESIKALGADFVKVRTHASRETYLAIAAEAKRAGLTLAGHAPYGVSLIEASDAGQKSIEHGPVFLNNYSDAEWNEIGARFGRNGTYVVPTLITGRGFREMPDKDVLAIIDDTSNALDPRRRYVPSTMLTYWRGAIDLKKYESPTDWNEVKRKNLHGFRLLHHAGVRMMTGTDLGSPLVFPGFGLHDELELLVSDIGMTPMEALMSATRNPAEYFGLGGTLGTVERGKLADLVLLDRDPLADIRNTRSISAIVLRGRLLAKPELARLLAAAEKAALSK